MDNVYLYNVDDLQSIAADYLKLRQEEVARCEKIITEKVAALLEANVRAKLAGHGDKRRVAKGAEYR